MKTLALIPARSGSKGLPHKNIAPLCGIPLLAYSIKSALDSGVCDEVFVCTDSQNYADIAMFHGAKVPFLRDSQNAKDESKTIDCVIESLQKYSHIGRHFDCVILLQPTSPLRTASHIKEAFNLFASSQIPLASVCEVRQHPTFMRTIKDGILSPIIPTSSDIRRQNLPKIYRLNGAIYINPTATLTPHTVLNQNQLAYVMDTESSIDIDTQQDFNQAQSILLKQ